MAFSLPTRFYGTVTLNGGPVPDGAPITAYVEEKPAGSSKATVSGNVSSYMIDVMATGGASEGSTVTFRVGDNTAHETGKVQAGMFVELNLTATSGEESSTTPAQQSSGPEPSQTSAEQSASDTGSSSTTPRRGQAGRFTSPAQDDQAAAGSGTPQNDGGGKNQ